MLDQEHLPGIVDPSSGSTSSSRYNDYDDHDDDDDDDALTTNDEHTIHDDDDDATEDEKSVVLGRRETRAVQCLKTMVMAILLVSGAVLAAGVYLYTSDDEESTFHDAFQDYAQQVVDTVDLYAQHKLEALGALALMMQAHAITVNDTWPFVTVPFFEDLVQSTKSLTAASGILLFPIVTEANRAAYLNYTREHRTWLNESYATQRAIQGGFDGLELPEDNAGNVPYPSTHEDWFNHLWTADYYNESNPDFSYGIANEIFHTVQDHPIVEEYGTGRTYFPQWQAAPAGWYYQSTVNLNYGSYPDFLQQTEIIQRTSNAAFGIAWTDQSTVGYVSTLLYPIFDRFAHGSGGNDDSDQKKKEEVVAFLGLDIKWQSFLENILPRETRGIQVVVYNSCGQNFTFLLQGDEAIFQGDGDWHDRAFDDLGRSTIFGNQLMEPVNADETSYIGPPLYGDYCTSTFYIYPTQSMQNAYVTHQPYYYAGVALVILVFTSAVFLLYDWYVERRQHLVFTTATRAERVVSSLFPAHVKEQLYEKNERQQQQQQQQAAAGVESSENNTNSGPGDFMGMQNPRSSLAALADYEINPIANLYPETTIMFADLAGFTSWSSGRKPSDVFLLLETLYGSFDALAKKRKVFKVETIGDCYVAATGIPETQEKHALIMTRFAQDCMKKMRSDLAALQEKLGGTTMGLALRVGLHSGAVTAGILRGEKSRFQLFGDTMNTAARMESNGIPNCIHVSETTADLLRQSGKGHWIEARDGMIEAKGKGSLQTFWIDTRAHNSSHKTSSLPSSTSEGDEETESREDQLDDLHGSTVSATSTGGDMETIEESLRKRFSPAST